MLSKEEFIKFGIENGRFSYYDKKDMILINDCEFEADLMYESFLISMGQCFECLYGNHVELLNVLRCKKCGTVIFERYDEDHEPNLKCPTCTDYKTSYVYYTSKEIENDKYKKDKIQMYIAFNDIKNNDYEKCKECGDSYNHEITNVKTLFKNKKIKIEIQILKFNAYLIRINIWERYEGSYLNLKKRLEIPLSIKFKRNGDKND